MSLFIIKGDLIEMNVDAIVNAANVNLSMVEGVSRAIYHKAGDIILANACKAIGHCDVGSSVETPSFGLTNCKTIIHTVGPIYINGKHNEKKNLISAYKSALKIAKDKNYTSIAFPLLSGEFNFPLNECYQIAVDTIVKFLKTNIGMNVYIVMYKNFPEFLKDEEQDKLTQYILNNQKLTPYIFTKETKFETLFKKYLRESKLSIEELAHKSNFRPSRINYLLENQNEISKEFVLAVGIAFNLDKKQLSEFLYSKGYILEPSQVRDAIICYFIERKIWDIYAINTILFKYSFRPLGSNK